jgi:hypothetical protein
MRQEDFTPSRHIAKSGLILAIFAALRETTPACL